MHSFTKENSSKKEQLKTKRWKNKDSVEFFEKIPIDLFRNWAIEGGFDDGCDVDLIYPYIINTDSLLEIGAAYGRVLKILLKKGYSGKIYAIERSKNFYNYLNKHYSGRATITHTSVQTFEPNNKVDAILWMWSGLGDFSKEEQLPILKRISTWLKPNGFLILETLLHTLKPINATKDQKEYFAIFSKYGTLYNYKPSKSEIYEYGKKLGFRHIKQIDYETVTKRQRILHILTNNSI